MDTLIALGTSAAYFYSLFVTIFPGFLIAQGLTLAFTTKQRSCDHADSTGKLFENRAKDKPQKRFVS